MPHNDKERGPRKQQPDRSERLAAELKANLKKRKDQARVRARAAGPVQKGDKRDT